MQQELSIVNDYKKQLGLLVAIGGAIIQTLPYSKGYLKIGLTKDDYIWLKSELKFNKNYFKELINQYNKLVLSSAFMK